MQFRIRLNPMKLVVVIITLSFIGTRWHSSLLDALMFRASDCDTDHFRVRVRMNVFPWHAMRAERGRRSVAVPILVTSSLEWGGWSTPHSAALHQQRAPYPSYRTLGCPRAGVGGCGEENISCPHRGGALHKLGRDCRWVNESHGRMTWRGSVSRSPIGLQLWGA
jgi:hypothetical protein